MRMMASRRDVGGRDGVFCLFEIGHQGLAKNCVAGVYGCGGVLGMIGPRRRCSASGENDQAYPYCVSHRFDFKIHIAFVAM